MCSFWSSMDVFTSAAGRSDSDDTDSERSKASGSEKVCKNGKDWEIGTIS